MAWVGLGLEDMRYPARTSLGDFRRARLATRLLKPIAYTRIPTMVLKQPGSCSQLSGYHELSLSLC